MKPEITSRKVTYVVLFLDKFNDVGGVVGQDTIAGSFNMFAQLLVNVDLLFCDGKDQVN